MQIPILSGTYGDANLDFRQAYPFNMEPVAMDNGISKGYLRPCDGIVAFSFPALGSALLGDKGMINWRDNLYRIFLNTLYYVAPNGVHSLIYTTGSVPNPPQSSFTYSFSHLAFILDAKLFYYDGSIITGLNNYTGVVTDVVWIDGYFVFTDGTFLIITDLNDRQNVNPLKYGSAELDPDSIVGVLKLRNELWAVGRYTMEILRNTGGSNFPFTRINGAQITRGAVTKRAACVFTTNTLAGVAFVGSGRNEPLSVWFALNGQTEKISTREIDLRLQALPETAYANVIIESRIDKDRALLYIHIANILGFSLVYDATASNVAGSPVWFYVKSENDNYRAYNMTWCYDKWICADPVISNLGFLSSSTMHHYDKSIEWSFSTQIVYNESRGAIFHEIELVSLAKETPSAMPINATPSVGTDYSNDGGLTYSTLVVRPIYNKANATKKNIKLVWLQQGTMQNFRLQRFRGASDGPLTVTRLEARIEPLTV